MHSERFIRSNVENIVDTNREYKKNLKNLQEYINSLYLNQYRRDLRGILDNFDEIKQFNRETDFKSIIINCKQLLNLILGKKKQLKLEKFENFDEAIEFIALINAESSNSKFYNIKNAQYTFALTELIITFLKDMLKSLK